MPEALRSRLQSFLTAHRRLRQYIELLLAVTCCWLCAKQAGLHQVQGAWHHPGLAASTVLSTSTLSVFRHKVSTSRSSRDACGSLVVLKLEQNRHDPLSISQIDMLCFFLFCGDNYGIDYHVKHGCFELDLNTALSSINWPCHMQNCSKAIV